MTEWTFDRDAIRSFRFVASRLDAQTGAVELVYRCPQRCFQSTCVLGHQYSAVC
jgi:hypothetical protein